MKALFFFSPKNHSKFVLRKRSLVEYRGSNGGEENENQESVVGGLHKAFAMKSEDIVYFQEVQLTHYCTGEFCRN